MFLISTETILEFDFVANVSNGAFGLVFPAVVAELHIQNTVSPARVVFCQALHRALALDACSDDLLFGPAGEFLPTSSWVHLWRGSVFLAVSAGACLDHHDHDYNHADEPDELLLGRDTRAGNATVGASLCR